MNNGKNGMQARCGGWTMVSISRTALMVLIGMLFSACGQDAATESAGSESSAATPAESKAFVTDAAIKSAQQAVESAEQRALKQSVRISGEVEKSTAQKQQESAQALEAASKKTDEVLRQAAAEASAAADSH